MPLHDCNMLLASQGAAASPASSRCSTKCERGCWCCGT
ncbi:hypothetical protein ACP70R_016619 [Stipagrostis hirtigluma subsp. patula]